MTSDPISKLTDSMSTVALPEPPAKRAILVLEQKATQQQLAQFADDLRAAFKQDNWPLVLNVGGPAYWLPVDDSVAMDLLRAAYTYISHFVPVAEGEINGFGVEAWCAAVEALEETAA